MAKEPSQPRDRRPLFTNTKRPDRLPYTVKHIVMNTFDERRANDPAYLRDFPQYVHCVYRHQTAYKPAPVLQGPLVQELLRQVCTRAEPSTSQTTSVRSVSGSSSASRLRSGKTASVQTLSSSSGRSSGRKARARNPREASQTGSSSLRIAAAAARRAIDVLVARDQQSMTRKASQSQPKLSQQQATSESPAFQQPTGPMPQGERKLEPGPAPKEDTQQAQHIKTIAADGKSPAGLGNQISAMPSDFEHIFHYSEAEPK